MDFSQSASRFLRIFHPGRDQKFHLILGSHFYTVHLVVDLEFHPSAESDHQRLQKKDAGMTLQSMQR